MHYRELIHRNSGKISGLAFSIRTFGLIGNGQETMISQNQLIFSTLQIKIIAFSVI
jgi:hypothetical protein